MTSKTYRELKFSDDFMFCKVLQSDPEICKEMIELIIDRKVGRIITDNSQQSIQITASGKGVRLDVYLEDDENTVYDIEMQTSDSHNLPARSRYYQGMIDLNLIQAGADYSDLKAAYIVFINTFDLFGKGRHKYTFRNICLEDPEIELNDGTTKIFLNAASTADGVPDDMRAFLKYVASGETESALSRKIDERVRIVRSNEEWEVEYMTLEQMYREKQIEKVKNLAIKAIKEGHQKASIMQILDISEDQYNEYWEIAALSQNNQ